MNYFKELISRGCTPNNAYPFSYRPHYAQYVDPETGTVSKIIVVPAAMVNITLISREVYTAKSPAGNELGGWL